MRLSARLSPASLIFPILLLWSSSALAQAKIAGTVVDEAGKAIKAATITAESENMGESFTASTDEKGRFTMIGLRPGRWRMTASAPGYLPEAGEVQLRSGNNANPPITIAIRRSGVGNGPLGNISARDLQSDLSAADALFTQKRWDDAISAYKALVSRTPSLTAIHLQIAAAYRAKGDYDSAIAAYGDILRVEPGSEKATIGISAAQVEKGDLIAAERTLTAAAESPTAGRETFYALGEVKQARGNATDAAVWYRKAAAADPSWGKPLYRLGLSAERQGDKTAAAEFMTKVIAVDPSSSEAGLARTAIEQLNK